MADEIAIDMNGLSETQQAIYEFSALLGDRVTLLALRAGANYMLKQLRAAEPVKTGRLRRATVVKGSRINQRRRNGKVGVYIVVKPGKNRKDERGAFYAPFVNRGYKRGKTIVPGKNFVSSTFASTKQQSLDIILQAIEQGGQQLVKEINRK